jgi:hypothetical protein
MKTSKTLKTKTVICTKEGIKGFASYVPDPNYANSAEGRRAQLRENGSNDMCQSIAKILEVLNDSGHFDESGYSVNDAISLRGDMEVNDVAKAFEDYVQAEVKANRLIKNEGCYSHPTYLRPAFARRDKRTILSDSATMAAPRLR